MKPIIALLALTTAAHAYGEDDPSDNHSTAHYDMALASARCAGFSADDARAIAEADEVTDTLSYGATAFTFPDREGRNKGFFHFPELENAVTATGDGALREWAEGRATLPISVCDVNGHCCDTTDSNCVDGGSLASVGIWLHSTADFWSHHACIASGGTDHGNFDAGSAAQMKCCDQTMHSHEWGRRETVDTDYMQIQANAIKGLEVARDVVTVYAAERGLAPCGTIADAEIAAFASATSSTARISMAAGLYAACDMACPATMASGDAGTGVDTPPPVGCGCASSQSGPPAAAIAIVLGAIVLRRRRR